MVAGYVPVRAERLEGLRRPKEAGNTNQQLLEEGPRLARPVPDGLKIRLKRLGARHLGRRSSRRRTVERL